jgi:hypothetical protein
MSTPGNNRERLEAMRLRRSKRRSVHTVTVLRRVPGNVRRFGHRVRDGVRMVRATAAAVVEQAPETVDAARTGALDTAEAVQRLPKSTLQWLAASSVGLGTGLFLSGAPRVVIAAGMTPALLIGAAIVARSTDSRSVGEGGRRTGNR